MLYLFYQKKIIASIAAFVLESIAKNKLFSVVGKSPELNVNFIALFSDEIVFPTGVQNSSDGVLSFNFKNGGDLLGGE